MSPWIPAVANFFLPGTGYILLGKKPVFAWLLIVGCILWVIWCFTDPLWNFWLWPTQGISSKITLGLIATIIVNLAFAYDAYQLAKEN